MLGGSSFVETLSDVDRTALFGLLRERKFDRGDVLMREGERGDDVAVVLTGRIKLEARSAAGQAVLLGIRGPGELLGEMAVFAGTPRAADAVALERGSVGVATAETLRRFVADRPDVSLVVIRMLAGRLREADRGRVEMGTNDALGRVCARLLDLARLYGREDGTAVRFTLPISQDELAGWVGASRPAVARALATLRADGIVTNERSNFVVHDAAALQARA